MKPDEQGMKFTVPFDVSVCGYLEYKIDPPITVKKGVTYLITFLDETVTLVEYTEDKL